MTEYKLSFLTGPGGIGKSQIAREYVIRSINNNKYNSIFYLQLLQKMNYLKNLTKLLFILICFKKNVKIQID